MSTPIANERIESRIYLIRGRRVMLDRDLAELYGVNTKVLNQAVKRTSDRFPRDFMFQLGKEEMENWRSQFVTSNQKKMGIRRRPYAFTENGVAMISSVLSSKRAIRVNIQIMRTFTRLRKLLASNEDLRRKVEALERKFAAHDQQFVVVFKAIKQILEPPLKPKRRIGFSPQ